MEGSSKNLPPVLAIAGPTASGKSRLGVEVAKAVGGEVVNADALQVYDRLRVITARPTDEEMAGVPHHLFGHVDPGKRYSVGAWSREAMQIIADIRARGRTAILVGGTGLYFRSLFIGLAPIPPATNAELEAELDTLQTADLRAQAERVDPIATAGVEGDDRRRLSRIVGVARQTGKTLTEWRDDTHPSITDWAGLIIDPELEGDREKLYSRIDARFSSMLLDGAMEEANGLLDLDPELPAMKAIGVAHLQALRRGEMDESTAISLSQRDSRRLAKRQMTWFRNQTSDWPRISMRASVDDALSAFGQGRA